MRIELEIGDNLKEVVQTFCRECSDKHNLGTEVSAAFKLNFGNIADKLIKNYLEEELKEIIIKVGGEMVFSEPPQKNYRMSVSFKQIEQVITDLEDMKESHELWANKFEANPEDEKKYVATGEWDDAKTHRGYIAKYECIIGLIKQLDIERRKKCL